METYLDNDVFAFELTRKTLRLEPCTQEPLLSRLWCIFELAAYRHANVRGKLTFQPVFIERNFLAIWPCWFFVCFTWQMANALVHWRSLMIIPGFICFAAVIPGVHAIRRGFQEQEDSLLKMANFDLSKVSCSDDADRQFILTALVEWYGSTAAFTDYVRGPLRDELVKVAEAATAPLSYCLLIYSPALGFSVDVLGALWNAGAPSEVIWSYFIGETISNAITSVAITQQAGSYCETVSCPVELDLLQGGLAMGLQGFSPEGITYRRVVRQRHSWFCSTCLH